MYLEPNDYRIYYINIDLRHQYGISVAELQMFLRAKRPQREEQGETVVFAGYLYISPPQTPREVVYKPRAHNWQFMVILDNSTDVMPKTTLAMPGQQLIITMSTFGLLSLPFALLNSL